MVFEGELPFHPRRTAHIELIQPIVLKKLNQIRGLLLKSLIKLNHLRRRLGSRINYFSKLSRRSSKGSAPSTGWDSKATRSETIEKSLEMCWA
jgi:hypothetical protein